MRKTSGGFSPLNGSQFNTSMKQYDEDITVGKLLCNQPEDVPYSSSSLCEKDISIFMNLPEEEMLQFVSPFFDQVDSSPREFDYSTYNLMPSPPITPPVTDDNPTSNLNNDIYLGEIPQKNDQPPKQEKLHSVTKKTRIRKPSKQRKATSGKRDRRANRSIHLWEFLLDLLKSGNSNHIKWISEEDGTFRLVNSSAVAKLWGEKKTRNNMTYEKMSRALRYYYEKQILERVPNARLIYKFGNRTRSNPCETSELESLSDSSDN